MEKPESHVDFKDVTVFRGNVPALHSISFKIAPGELVFLTGRTGSGKTTLLKTLYAQLQIESGEATVLGHDLRKIHRKEIPYLRRRLGIIFQDFQLLSDRTAAQNLEFVLLATGWKNKKTINHRINEVLNLVGLPTKGFKMPHELSGGEQQRIGVARALLNNPNLILADEPTGNLDPHTAFEIISLISSLTSPHTSVIIATHNHNLMDKFPGRIIVMDKGKISFDSGETM